MLENFQELMKSMNLQYISNSISKKKPTIRHKNKITEPQRQGDLSPTKPQPG